MSLAYVPKQGWPEFIAYVLSFVPNDGRFNDAAMVLEFCHRKGFYIANLYESWRYWCGVKYNPQWLKEFTAGDWRSFRAWCENEYAKFEDVN